MSKSEKDVFITSLRRGQTGFLITTFDGSHTLFSEQFNEVYHSQHGAIRESEHVFIKAGLDYFLQFACSNKARIFELGFGTGLNALLTVIESQKRDLDIYYETIELYPVALETIKEMNYTLLLENEKYRPPFHSMHLSTWDTEHTITPDFTFKKINESLVNWRPSAGNFNIIYFDAFAPENQPEMWSIEVMKKMYSMLAPDGILVSYCCKRIFKQALKEVGFSIEKIAGPPGKREMIRAVKS